MGFLVSKIKKICWRSLAPNWEETFVLEPIYSKSATLRIIVRSRNKLTGKFTQRTQMFPRNDFHVPLIFTDFVGVDVIRDDFIGEVDQKFLFDAHHNSWTTFCCLIIFFFKARVELSKLDHQLLHSDWFTLRYGVLKNWSSVLYYL